MSGECVRAWMDHGWTAIGNLGRRTHASALAHALKLFVPVPVFERHVTMSLYVAITDPYGCVSLENCEWAAIFRLGSPVLILVAQVSAPVPRITHTSKLQMQVRKKIRKTADKNGADKNGNG